jgi:hypothetical protein
VISESSSGGRHDCACLAATPIARHEDPLRDSDGPHRASPVSPNTTRKVKPLHRAPELMCSHACVALGRVEVLVPQQLLDLAQVGPGTEQFRGEDVPERVRRHPLALADPGGSRVAEECLGHDRLREPATLHADEEGRLGISCTDTEVVEEERLERGVDRQDALPAALRPPHLQEAALEVDVCPVEAE